MTQIKNTGRIEILHLLRGLAALSVCLFHFTSFGIQDFDLLPEGNWLRMLGAKGYLGIHVFFILSGFLVPYSAYKGGYTYGKWFSFLKRRLVRIEPPYIMSVLIMFFGYYFLSRYKNWLFPWGIKDLIYNITYLVEWVNGSWINVTYWTLAIEFQFYVLLIFILPLIFNSKKWVRYVCFIVLGCITIAFKSKAFLFGHLPLFMIGMVMAQFYLGLWKKLEYTLLLLGGLGVLAYQYYSVDVWVLGIAVLTLVVFHLCQQMKPINGYLGDISYSLYITHCIILAFGYGTMLIFWKGWQGSLVWGYVLVIIGILSSIAFAHVFYKLIERPAQQLSRRLGK